MSRLTDGMEDARMVVKLAETITIKASKRVLTRVLLMTTVGIVILGSYLGYLTYLLGEYRHSSDEHNATYGYLVAENQDKRTIDYIELCIEATRDTDANRDYYCSTALDLYKTTFKDMPEGTDENIQKAAFGAMKADVAARIRSMALERTVGQTPAMDSVLKFLLSIAGIVIAALVAAIGMTVTIVWTWRISKALLAPAQNTHPPALP